MCNIVYLVKDIKLEPKSEIISYLDLVSKQINPIAILLSTIYFGSTLILSSHVHPWPSRDLLILFKAAWTCFISWKVNAVLVWWRYEDFMMCINYEVPHYAFFSSRCDNPLLVGFNGIWLCPRNFCLNFLAASFVKKESYWMQNKYLCDWSQKKRICELPRVILLLWGKGRVQKLFVSLHILFFSLGCFILTFVSALWVHRFI